MQTSIDISALVNPITEERPTGESLREDPAYDSLYYQLKETRNLARSIERQLDQEATDNLPDGEWGKVITLATEILVHQSKDLEVCAWLVEALTRKFGFIGLRDGFSLTRQLVEQYWEELYPRADEDGPISRIAALVGLNGRDSEGTLVTPIANIPLTNSESHDNIRLWQYRRACEIDRITDQDQKAKVLADGAISLRAIEQRAAATSSKFFQDLVEAIQGGLEEFDLLAKLLDERCVPEVPPTSRIHSLLVECLETVKILGKDRLSQNKGFELTNQTDGISQIDGGEPVEELRGGGKITGRNQALNTLAQVADFFQQTEPHSPVSYLIRKAIRWGNLSLAALMSELVVDSKLRGELFTMVGIEQQNVEKDGG